LQSSASTTDWIRQVIAMHMFSVPGVCQIAFGGLKARYFLYDFLHFEQRITNELLYRLSYTGLVCVLARDYSPLVFSEW